MTQDVTGIEEKASSGWFQRAREGLKGLFRPSYTPLSSDLTRKGEPILQMPAGVELRLEDIVGNQVVNPEVKADLTQLAPVALHAHQEMMDYRLMKILRESRTAIPVLFGGREVASRLLSELEQKRKTGEVGELDPQGIDLAERALREATQEWHDEKVNASRLSSSRQISQIDVTQRSNDAQRRVHYWIREITETPTFLTKDQEHRVEHDTGFGHGWDYDPILLGRKDKNGNFERIETLSQVRINAESLNLSPEEFVEQSGIKRLYLVELQSVVEL